VGVLVVLAVLTTVTSLLGGCAPSRSERTASGRLRVVAAFFPIAEAVERVGGDRVSVRNLTPAGTEPHDLELTTGAVDAIEDSAVMFLLGDDFQPALEQAAGRRDGPTVDLLDGLPSTTVGRHASDPHVWLDPVLYSDLVGEVEQSLARVDPAGARDYARNARSFRREIDAVDQRYRVGLRDCARRTLVTSHAAFGYLARRYDLRQASVGGVDPEAEPGASRLAQLADVVRRTGTTTIFTEPLVSSRVADALAREAGGVRTQTLNPLEGLTEGERARGDGWVAVMDRNLAKLRTALGCA